MDQTYTFDDGSTITRQSDGGVSSTATPAGWALTDYAANFSPSNMTPGASSWADVLTFGIGRLADYKVASLQAQNTAPQYAAQQQPATPAYLAAPGMNMGSVLMWGGLALGAFVLVSALGGKRKG